MKGAVAVAALLALALTPAYAGIPNVMPIAPDGTQLKPVFDQYASLITNVLMQKEKNPENATKLLSNLVGVAGAHIDALDEHGYTDKFQNFKQPQILTDVLNYTQAIGDAVSTWLPDHIGFDKFAANYTQSVSLATTALTGLVYAPCIISNLPTGAAISATGIAISPLGVYITPEGANIQPEGFKVLPSIIYIGSGGENIQPQGVNIAPALISISPVHDQIGAAGLNASPVGISVGVAAAAPDDAGGAGGTTTTSPQTTVAGGK